MIACAASKMLIGLLRGHVFVMTTSFQLVVVNTPDLVMFFAKPIVQGHGNIIVILV